MDFLLIFITTFCSSLSLYSAQDAECYTDGYGTSCPSSVLLQDGPFEPREHNEVLVFIAPPGATDMDKVGVLKADKFSKLNDIVSLRFIGVGIHTIEPGAFRGLDKLQTLYIQNSVADSNKLTSLPENAFDGLRKLTDLTILFNNLTEINLLAFAGLESLERLNLKNNHLTELKPGVFENLSRLKDLDLSENNLGGSPDSQIFLGLENLKTLRLEHNQISSLSEDLFEGTPRLEDLYLFNNKIEEINIETFKKVPELRYLSLEHNQLSSLTESWGASLSNLEVLNLNRNKLRDLKCGMFEGLSNLKRLFLSNNLIETIDEDAFKEASHLELCNLALNGMYHNTNWEKIISNAGNLHTLVLSPENLKCEDFHNVADLMNKKGGRLVLDGKVGGTCKVGR